MDRSDIIPLWPLFIPDSYLPPVVYRHKTYLSKVIQPWENRCTKGLFFPEENLLIAIGEHFCYLTSK